MVKISMMPLRGLLFGVRLNAKLGITAVNRRSFIPCALLRQPETSSRALDEQEMPCDKQDCPDCCQNCEHE
jgi:hypothetical protein